MGRGAPHSRVYEQFAIKFPISRDFAKLSRRKIDFRVYSPTLIFNPTLFRIHATSCEMHFRSHSYSSRCVVTVRVKLIQPRITFLKAGKSISQTNQVPDSATPSDSRLCYHLLSRGASAQGMKATRGLINRQSRVAEDERTPKTRARPPAPLVRLSVIKGPHTFTTSHFRTPRALRNGRRKTEKHRD